MKQSRRKAIKNMGKGAAALSMMGMGWTAVSCGSGEKSTGKAAQKMAEEVAKEVVQKEPFFKISLAQWSLHNSFFGDALKGGFGKFGEMLQKDPDSLLRGELDPVDFPSIAKNKFGLDAVEYVNTFYFGKINNAEYWKDLKNRCDSEGVKSVLIMCDALGDLGNLDDKARQQAVENHYPWVETAKFMGCHSIRVNAAGQGTADEVRDAAIQGLGALTEFGESNGINIIVENHGGYSSNGEWLASVMKGVNNPYCGTLPDFGNFCIKREGGKCVDEYDRYKGMRELMPFAKGVSAKTHEFDENGNEIHTDFKKMLQIVKDAGYTGYVDIEYEGQKLSEEEGIKATKRLLERVGQALS